jgi:phage-related holin
MNREILKEIGESIIHMSNINLATSKVVLSMLASWATVIAHAKGFMIDNGWQFAAVAVLVIADGVFGIGAAIKQDRFETRRALKLIWYMVFYEGLLGTCLLIEKAFPIAFFLSEAVILPIIIFQLISILKHATILGLLTSKQLTNIINRIDKYKDK